MQIDVGYFYFIKDSFFDVIIEKLFRCKIMFIAQNFDATTVFYIISIIKLFTQILLKLLTK